MTLVNLSGTGTRTVVVQAGAFAEHDIDAAGYTWAAPGWTGTHTEYISHDVEITGREAAVGGPWLDVELPPGTEVTLTLRLRLRARAPSAGYPLGHCATGLRATGHCGQRHGAGGYCPGRRGRERMTMGQLTGLRALVTGGASGIGAAIAATFAAEGAAVVVSTWPPSARARCRPAMGYVTASTPTMPPSAPRSPPRLSRSAGSTC